MYEFHYDYIRNKYDNISKLLFTDTDNLMYEIKTEDDYGVLNSDIAMLVLVIIWLSQNAKMIQTNSHYKNER